jgi:hypothetical protein
MGGHLRARGNSLHETFDEVLGGGVPDVVETEYFLPLSGIEPSIPRSNVS